jgi:hypothetical protein
MEVLTREQTKHSCSSWSEQEAREVLLRSYTAISLALPGLAQGRQPKSTFECFFDFKQDTLYIAASENVTAPYADYAMNRLNTSLLYRVQSLALQGEEFWFWCEEFYAGPPYNNMTPTTAVSAEKLKPCMLEHLQSSL